MVGGRAAVDGLHDLGGLPLDLLAGSGGQQPTPGSTAEPVDEHGPLATAAIARRACRPATGAYGEEGTHGARLFQDRQQHGCLPIQSNADDLLGCESGDAASSEQYPSCVAAPTFPLSGG